jgi:hypothetical protein
MAERAPKADEVLVHSEDEDEWEDEPEQIESRPSGTQVISARLPSALAEELLAAAAQRKVRPSDVVREAVEKWLHAMPAAVFEIQASAGQNMRVVTPAGESKTENFNLVVQVETDPNQVEVVEAVA